MVAPDAPAAGGRDLALRRLWFWAGSLLVAAGVCMHLPMFLGARDMGYVLSGMSIDPLMVAGMVCIGAGLAGVVYGLSPTREQRRKRVRTAVQMTALDETPIGRQHILLMAVLCVAVAVDSQKPFTFTFILPGVASEYHLSSPGHSVPGALPVALYPFVAIVGTVIGSLAWGAIGDLLGRRMAVLLSAILFMATSICGAMPLYSLNLVMCFWMGVGAGGLLPTAYALLAEIVPARRRGQVIVLVAGIGTGLGFLLTSGLANWTMPHFGWRIMWFYNLPTGGLLILLNRFIPESPRFLIEYGRVEEAQEITHRFGAALVPVDAEALESHHGVGALFRGRFLWLTTALVLYGLGWGAVNFGFLTWLPSEVASHGLSVGQVSGILTNASLFSLPGAVAVSWLYGRSSKLAMVVVAALTAAALATFVVAGAGIASHTVAFTALLVGLLVSLWGVISVLAPYSAEVYPTRLRARGAGLAAGASKLGGVIALGMGVAGIAPPDLAGAAAMTGAAVVVGAVAIGTFGIETRRRRLEEITAPDLARATA